MNNVADQLKPNNKSNFSLIILILFTILVFANCKSQKVEKSKLHPSLETCKRFLNSISNYWSEDSLGSNGFRWLVSYYMIENNYVECNLTKSDIVKALGIPYKTDKVFIGKKNKECTEYHYYSLRQNFTAIKNISDRDLIITVDGDSIIEIAIRIFE